MTWNDKIMFRFMLITDRINCPGNFFDKVIEAVNAGVGALQLREKQLPGASYLEYARTFGQITRKHNIPLIINDRIDVALASNSQGIHLPSESFPVAAVRELVGNQCLIGKSTHHIDEALRVAKEGIDYLFFGPIYETPSKLKYGKPQGIEKLRELCQKSPVPVFAIGGINLMRVNEIFKAGAYGFAVISSVFQSNNISDTVARFQDSLISFGY
jgi:thiamine-phosphate pyrophosphorylase